jgi:protein-tyrosine phosphatase
MFRKLFFNNSDQKAPPLFTTDIHSHLLPGIDDGATTMEDSLSMIRHLSELGFTHLITTPHIMWDSYKNTPEIIREKLTDVRSACLELGIDIKIDAAAEYFLDEHFFELLHGKGDLLTFPGNRILVELPYSTPLLNTAELLFSIVGYGYTPILAHPERYSYFHAQPEIYRTLRDQGCELQVNALSVTKQYGSDVQKVAQWLLKNELVTYLGTDAHHLRHVAALESAFKTKYLKNYLFSNNRLRFE